MTLEKKGKNREIANLILCKVTRTISATRLPPSPTAWYKLYFL